MARIIPVSDMMLDEILNAFSSIKATAIEMGIWMRMIRCASPVKKEENNNK